MLSRVTQKDLDQAWTDHGKTYGGHKNDYFALLYLAKKFGGEAEDYAHKVAFGSNDYGIDAFHFDVERRNLYLLQFKWSESAQLFKQSMDRLIDAGMERIFGNPKQDQNKNPLLLQLKAELGENRAIVDQVFIQFIFNGDAEEAERSKALDAKREDLDAKKFFIDQCFGREVRFTVEYLSNKPFRNVVLICGLMTGTNGPSAVTRSTSLDLCSSVMAFAHAPIELAAPGACYVASVQRLHWCAGHGFDLSDKMTEPSRPLVGEWRIRGRSPHQRSSGPYQKEPLPMSRKPDLEE
jgi:hypothetical protein